MLLTTVLAQRGIGMRFSANSSHFFRAEDHPLVDGSWTNLVIGPFWKSYPDYGGFEAGINFVYKPSNSDGLPVIMDDYPDGQENQRIGLMGAEFDFKAGPRFDFINPKIGMKLGYRFSQDGYFKRDTASYALNNIYFNLPIGCSGEFPTEWGCVGFGIFYEIGITNVYRNPDPGSGVIHDGSKVRSLNIEITVAVATGDQKRKVH